MTVTRVLLSALLLLTRRGARRSRVVNRLPLPGDGPDLVLLVADRARAGRRTDVRAVTGFGAGLLVDLMPPTATEVGRWALVFCLVGYLAGQVRMDARRSALIVIGDGRRA